jgi:uncharacterized membrane protein
MNILSILAFLMIFGAIITMSSSGVSYQTVKESERGMNINE